MYEIPVITLRVVRDGTVVSGVKQIRSPADAAAILMERYGSLDREVFIVVHLDTRSRITGIEPVATGGLSALHINMRELLKGAILSNSAAILLCHNHPSGDPTPSPEDVAITKRIVAAAGLFDIQVVDHIIVGGNNWLSLRERGLGFDT